MHGIAMIDPDAVLVWALQRRVQLCVVLGIYFLIISLFFTQDNKTNVYLFNYRTSVTQRRV